MMNKSEQPEERETETVLCYMCDTYYQHPVGAVAGYGKCEECFFKMFDEEMLDAKEWKEIRTPVWIIGFPRCGSVSMCEALRILGWNPIHNPRHWDQLENHDAAGDAWITAHWRELHSMFPDSRFILNLRDVDSWLASLHRIPEFWQSNMLYDRYLRSRVYGTHDVTDAATLRTRWNEHVDAVRKSIPREQLLEFHQPFRWEPLCEFLDVTIPDSDFPWRSRATCEDARLNHSQR